MSNPRTLLVDTNILLRFFIQDQPEQARAVKKLVRLAKEGALVLEVPFTAVAEAAFTLRRFYKVEPEMIARMLTGFLSGSGVRQTGPSWLLDALEEFRNSHASFGDVCIAAEARASGSVVASFDKDFDKFLGIERFEPVA